MKLAQLYASGLQQWWPGFELQARAGESFFLGIFKFKFDQIVWPKITKISIILSISRPNGKKSFKPKLCILLLSSPLSSSLSPLSPLTISLLSSPSPLSSLHLVNRDFRISSSRFFCKEKKLNEPRNFLKIFYSRNCMNLKSCHFLDFIFKIRIGFISSNTFWIHEIARTKNHTKFWTSSRFCSPHHRPIPRLSHHRHDSSYQHSMVTTAATSQNGKPRSNGRQYARSEPDRHRQHMVLDWVVIAASAPVLSYLQIDARMRGRQIAD